MIPTGYGREENQPKNCDRLGDTRCYLCWFGILVRRVSHSIPNRIFIEVMV